MKPILHEVIGGSFLPITSSSIVSRCLSKEMCILHIYTGKECIRNADVRAFIFT